MSNKINYYSDYGSGSSTNSTFSWPTQDAWSSQHNKSKVSELPGEQKSASYQDLLTGKCTLEDIMKEFQMNGLDSPYTPDDDRIWKNHTAGLSGLGPASPYLRQQSWPEPERSPAPRLPRPRSEWIPSHTALEFNAQEFTTSTPINDMMSAPAAAPNESGLTEDQLRVLNSLPNAVLFSLIRELENTRGDLNKRSKKLVMECRFCKNNGERESYCRSHALKDTGGRVTCPVLRAFVCKRCGARGDSAHTIKYCPFSTADERIKSAAMMRSVRLASGRRRAASLTPAGSAAACPPRGPAPAGSAAACPPRGPAPTGIAAACPPRDPAPPPALTDGNVCSSYALYSQLDPLWAALEQKLML